jgi:hypothetical protein
MQPHLLGCSHCGAQVAWLEHVIGLMRTDMAADPPAHVAAAAKRLFRPPAIPAPPLQRRQFTATLQFDSARSPVALGMRSGVQTKRQMLFAVSSILLDLRIVPHGALWAVSGQLLGADGGRQVELHGPAGTARAELNALSEFALPPSPPGSYVLTFQLTDRDITIDSLELGA